GRSALAAGAAPELPAATGSAAVGAVSRRTSRASAEKIAGRSVPFDENDSTVLADPAPPMASGVNVRLRSAGDGFDADTGKRRKRSKGSAINSAGVRIASRSSRKDGTLSSTLRNTATARAASEKSLAAAARCNARYWSTTTAGQASTRRSRLATDS